MPDVKLEVTGDLQGSINTIFSDMRSELEKQKAELKNNKAAADYIAGLDKVREECDKQLEECKIMIPLHNAAMANDGKPFLAKWDLCREKFLPINTMVGLQVKSGKLNIPPLTDEIKTELKKTSTPQMMSFVEKYHQQSVDYRDKVKSLFGKVFTNHKKLNDSIKRAIEIKKQEAGGSVAPAHQKPILSSSHEAKNQGSLNQAQAANQRAQAPVGQQREQGAKK
jgi:hypothetical protein